MLICRLLACWMLSLCAALPLQAAAAPDPLAEPRFASVGREGSIAQNVVSALAQDPAGFLWIGTGAGLLRYDGFDFRSQSAAPAGQAAKPLGFVRSLLMARDGRLWIGTESDGLAVLDPATERLVTYRSEAGSAASLTLGTIRALAEDGDGAIWVGTIGGGLDRLEPASGRIEHQRQGGTLALDDDRVQSLLVDRRGHLWVGTWRGLSRRPAGGQTLQPVAPRLRGRIVATLFEASDGRIWAGTQQGELALLDGEGEELLVEAGQTAEGGGAVYSFVEAQPGQVWAGRAGGIEQRDAQGLLQRRIRHHPLNPSGLAGNEVRVLLRDQAGWVWVGGYGGGLQQHDPANHSIWVRRQDLGPGAPLEPLNARSLLQLDDGSIWVGTNTDGVVVMDERLRPQGSLRTGQGALRDGRIGGMAQTRDGSIWLGSDAGLLRLDRQRRVLQQLKAGEGRVRRLLAARDGGLWVATQDGLYRHRDGQISRLALADGQVLSGDINALAEDGEGTLWVGSEKGLWRLPAGAAGLLPVPERLGAGLAHASVVGLLFARDGRLWVDTALGLHRLQSWDGRQAAFLRVTQDHKLGGRAFGANLLEDRRGRIWTQQFVYDPAQDSVTELTAADGVDFGTGWFRAYTALADGRLLFGGSKGLLVVTPDAFDRWRYAPPVVATELRIDGRRQAVAAREARLRLAPGQRRFSLEFAALDFSDPARTEYAYRLQGFESDWVHTGANFRVASYGALPPGDYTLQVRATNRSGAWSPQELAIPIQVLPAWWQTWWARSLAVLLGLGLLWGVAQLRTAVLRRRQLALELRVSERTQALEQLSRALQQKTAELEEVSLCDPLTGLRNRRFLTQHIEGDVALVQRHHEGTLRGADTPPADEGDLIFFLLDLDHFKAVNDAHGHAAGDALLMQMHERLRPVFRESDYLVRWGGEEFLIVARATSRRHAAELAERARAMVADRPFVLEDGTRLAHSCSLGFACYPLSPAHPRALAWSQVVDLADAALYAAKRAGRNTWVGVMDAPGLDEAALLARARRPLAEWLDSGELEIVRPPAR